MQRALILIFSAVLHAGLVAAAEAPTKLPSVGILTEDSSASALAVIKKALADLGDIDGKTISVQSRSAGGRIERLDEVASELAQNVDVIVAEGISAGQAARRQTRKPIVVASRLEVVRPSGNVTGATNISAELGVQRLRLLKELSPRVSRVSILWHEATAMPSSYLKQVRKTAESLSIDIEVRKMKSSSQFQATFDAMAADKDNGVIIEPQFLFSGRLSELAALSLKGRLASMSGIQEFAAAGGLASYGLSPGEMWRHTAILVDRIFKLRKPKPGQTVELPAAQPEKFEFAVNVKAAAHLGLALAPDALKRADTVLK